MSFDTEAGTSTLHELTEPAGRDNPDRPNTAVIAAITGHHAQLAAQLNALTDAVFAAVRGGVSLPARDHLLTWYRDELLPHAVAEERALYSLASEHDSMRLLLCGMLAEHRSLVRLVEVLAGATGAVEVAVAAAAAQAVFAVHVSKENDLLLPALDQAGVDLAAALHGMHEVLGSPTTTDPDRDSACGCGCAHDDGAAARSSVLLQVVAAPAGSTELDVRALPHGQRHEIIFDRLDKLAPRQSLVIVNDHDPKPLRYQTSALWPDCFEWTYQASGPEIWRVAITRVR